jgi:DNA-binding transcriptional MerR regulator
MGRDGLLIGEVAERRGVSRKALRLYEDAGILRAARRTASGYRVYAADTLETLSFVRQAQRLGFTLEQIKDNQEGRALSVPTCSSARATQSRRTRSAFVGLAGCPRWPARLAEGLATRQQDAGCRRPPHRNDQINDEGGEEMKVTLCTECENCPEVELTDKGVKIGEVGNLALLTHKEWNLLVDLVQTGELSKVSVPA